LTVSGTAAKLYVDGGTAVTATTGKSTYNLGTGAAYIGSDSGTGEFFQGRLDNVAIYSTALSATRVGVHYTSGQSTAGGYSPTPMTASAAMPGGTVPSPGGYTATAMTATADMPAGFVTRTAIVSVTQDDDEFDSGGSGSGSATTVSLGVGGSPYQRAYFDLPAPTLAAGETLISATLVLTSTFNTGTKTIEIARVTGTWDEATLTNANKPTATVVGSQSVTFTANTAFSIDVTNVLSTTNYGVRLSATSGSGGNATVASTENATSAYRPYIEYLIQPAPITPGGFTAQPMTADTAMPTVTWGIGKDAAAAPMTATADMPSPIVSGVRHVAVTAERMDSYADMMGGEWSSPLSVGANPFTAEADMYQGAASTQTHGVIYTASAIEATASWIKPALVNDEPITVAEEDDRYFQRVFALAPSVWQRLNDKGGTAVDRMGRYNGIYHGVQVGKFTGPDERHSVHFTNGSYVEQIEPSATNVDEAWIQDGSAAATALEFSFKTNKANAFLMAGADSTQTSRGVVSAYAARELFLVNGKLTFRSRIFAGTPDQIEKEFTGLRNLADDEWHHVVVKSGVYSRGEWGVELWIDGTFEMRRFNTNGFVGFPDFIGFRPNIIDGSELETLPLSQGFVGDMTEVVFYNHNNLPSHDIARNYYAFMGWIPVEAPSLDASATMTEGYGHGNQKKALYLYWTGQDEVFGGLPGKVNQPLSESVSFDPDPSLVNAATYSGNLYANSEGPEETGEYFGFKVFTKSITRDKTNNTSYRDPITDDPSLINLEHDVDLRDFDIIMFKDWPDEGYETDYYEANFPGQKERLLEQLRDANDKGTGLFVTNPRLAVDLGIIDRVEFVPSLRESRVALGQGNATGLYDYGSAVKFPWDIVGSDGLNGGTFAQGIGKEQTTTPAFLANKAYFYYDNNRNNKFRVRALVEGLTTLPSYMVEDAVFHVDFDQYGWQGVAFKYLHRESGLEIGDEYIFNGAPEVDGRFLGSTDLRYMRPNGTWATPPGHVKAGTVVTTFAANHWNGTSQTINPYADYATTIVVESGTVLNGRATGGRIFVNFTETPSKGLGVPVQVLPGSQDALDNPFGFETGPTDDDTIQAFPSTGNAEQNQWVTDALAACTFPLQALKPLIAKGRWGRNYIPIVWVDLDPGLVKDSQTTMGKFHPDMGTIEIDEASIRRVVETMPGEYGSSFENLVKVVILHEIAHAIDFIYLKPYQRANIWNVFHEDWNLYHNTHGGVIDDPANYRIPPDTVIDPAIQQIVTRFEYWFGGSQYFNRVGEAFANAFVVAYSEGLYVNAMQYDPHPAFPFIGPKIRAAIETGIQAYIFDAEQVASEWPVSYPPETNAQRKWEYSWTRTSLAQYSETISTRPISIVLPDGTKQTVRVGVYGNYENLPLATARSSQLFPLIYKPRLEMTARGIYWLADEQKPAEGDVVIRTAAMTASAETKQPAVVAQHNAGIYSPAMKAVGNMPKVAEDADGAVEVLTLSMDASASFTGNGRVVSASPMTAVIEVLENFTTVRASGEQVVLTLHGYDITLFLKEES
jgi:hypothetical protein